MQLLTEDALLVCNHVLGRVDIEPTQPFVTIAGRRVLVEKNPEGRAIKGCPNASITIKPCTNTLAVKKGYSDLLRIGQKRVCLDTVTGLTDGTPPGQVRYRVYEPGQPFVREVP